MSQYDGFLSVSPVSGIEAIHGRTTSTSLSGHWLEMMNLAEVLLSRQLENRSLPVQELGPKLALSSGAGLCPMVTRLSLCALMHSYQSSKEATKAILLAPPCPNV